MSKITRWMSIATMSVGAMAAAVLGGCRSGGHEQPHTAMIVQTTTQPADGAAPSGDSRRVEVTVRDSATAAATRSLVGHICRVQFRRDALGMATPAPLPIGADISGGRPVAVVGKVVMCSDGWVVLESDGRATWIPQSAILVVEVRD